MDQVTQQLHPDLQSLYNLWSQGKRQLGYLGAEGLRGLPGLSTDPTKEELELLNVAIRANQLVCNKNYLKVRLTDQINKGQTPDWITANQEYIRMTQELFTLDCQLKSQNTHSI
jgi:hypothetical protein